VRERERDGPVERGRGTVPAREREREGPTREREMGTVSTRKGERRYSERERDGPCERRGERWSLHGDGSTEKEREGLGWIGTVATRERGKAPMRE